jgi:hypothetical protein
LRFEFLCVSRSTLRKESKVFIEREENRYQE